MSKFNSTSSDYFKNVYKHRIPLRSYKPRAPSKQKIAAKCMNKLSKEFEGVYDTSEASQIKSTSELRK